VVKKRAKGTQTISDKKKRGEWVELRFMAEAAERDLPASKPLGDSENFDVVGGRPGKFVAVQVKCTVFAAKNGDGYVCSVCSSHKVYRPGAFDFLAAFVVPKETWYILPEKEVQGMRSVTLASATGLYEQYREAWQLLREAVQVEEQVEVKESVATAAPVVRFGGNAFERMQLVADVMRRRMGLKEEDGEK
jgi:PD-(D/E)XK endonuclease